MKNKYEINVSVNADEYWDTFTVEADKVRVGKENNADFDFPIYIDSLCLHFEEPIMRIKCNDKIIYERGA